jgi:hypothetical protein
MRTPPSSALAQLSPTVSLKLPISMFANSQGGATAATATIPAQAGELTISDGQIGAPLGTFATVLEWARSMANTK